MWAVVALTMTAAARPASPPTVSVTPSASVSVAPPSIRRPRIFLLSESVTFAETRTMSASPAVARSSVVGANGLKPSAASYARKWAWPLPSRPTIHGSTSPPSCTGAAPASVTFSVPPSVPVWAWIVNVPLRPRRSVPSASVAEVHVVLRTTSEAPAPAVSAWPVARPAETSPPASGQ